MNQTIIEDTIPKSFTISVDRPFEPIGIKQLYDQRLKPVDQSERLTDEQMIALTKNPIIEPNNERLQNLTNQANEKRLQDVKDVKIYNLSIKEIGVKTSSALHSILDDMLLYNPQDGVKGIIHIFTKEDRLMYVGITVIAFTIILMLIKTSD